MVDRRPIVFYERLMNTYDGQVAALMAAKTSYILLATEDTDAVNLSSASVTVETPVQATMVTPRQQVVVEVLQPRVVPAMPELPEVEPLVEESKPVEPAPVKQTTVASMPTKPHKVITGLGLSLDDILSEEASVAARGDSQYFDN
ncbi:hypothetical protein [Weissella cibaria]|uniref:hypothetical protein n=1 Tax=Weissella cibaria TaxID=137591 RepID=UPI00021915E0|nr:hypothetical protein [Weissella cibaria]APS27527.1 hypothetical protein AUC63_01528 [Weissella cibaria]APU62925.1 hypothetical protein AUC65_01134 [Weissella cibaria]APU65076.1 hypothetical protein AUC62_01127 [Weissella cibaria]ASS51548.1 hypothetical protein CHR48_00557 [Weissella cibaria]UJF01189.1 hypothetical protein L1O50_05540 [Weissella cibaria]